MPKQVFRNGVTLVELAIGVFILGIVAFLAPLLFRMMNSFSYVQQSAQTKSEARDFFWQINHDIENASEMRVVDQDTLKIWMPDLEQFGAAPHPANVFEQPALLRGWVPASSVTKWGCSDAAKTCHKCNMGGQDYLRSALLIEYNYRASMPGVSGPHIERSEKRFFRNVRYDCSPDANAGDWVLKRFLVGKIQVTDSKKPLFAEYQSSQNTISVYIPLRHAFFKGTSREYTILSTMRTPNQVSVTCANPCPSAP